MTLQRMGIELGAYAVNVMNAGIEKDDDVLKNASEAMAEAGQKLQDCGKFIDELRTKINAVDAREQNAKG